MIAVDTSVVVAGIASWHEAHAVAVEVLSQQPRLPAHVALESFSVLTRLPPPHRFEPVLVGSLLAARFPEPFLTLPAKHQRVLLEKAIGSSISGGAIYDALVAATAKHAGATLLTRDKRALSVYRQIGVDFRIVE